MRARQQRVGTPGPQVLANLLTEFVPYLPEPLLGTVIDVVSEDAGNMTVAIGAFAAVAPRQELVALWGEALHALGARDREGVLHGLRDMAPAIHALGGKNMVNETVSAIQTAVKLFPYGWLTNHPKPPVSPDAE